MNKTTFNRFEVSNVLWVAKRTREGTFILYFDKNGTPKEKEVMGIFFNDVVNEIKKLHRRGLKPQIVLGQNCPNSPTPMEYQ